MKLLFLLLGITLLKPETITGFYDLQFKTIDGAVVNTFAFQGKKIVVAVISASTQNLSLIGFLDSLQKKNGSIQVIAVPTGDFGGNIKVSDLKSINRDLSIVVSEPLIVKKASTSQHPLFSWLTHVSSNSHFDVDVTGEGHVFVVNSSGEMVSCLKAGVPKEVILKIVQLAK